MVVMAGALFVGQEALAKVFTGTAGDDTLVGTDGEDSLKGRRGADRLKGNCGEDRLKGNSGNDKIIPGKGSDKVYAGAGNDRIYARGTEGVDHIDCGYGFDKVETIHRGDQEKLRENPRPSRRCDNGYHRYHYQHHEYHGHHRCDNSNYHRS
jgi:Ca2+-binding RTX toxin-like protein